jgi:prepilin-type N-terminal cleavage/methylation domain-containing protein
MDTKQQRRGVSLLELIAVVALMGIFFTAGIVRLGPSAANNMSARAAARLLATDLRHAQRQAITTGDDHYLEFQTQSSTITGYRTYRDDGGSGEQVDDLRDFPSRMTVTSAESQLRFDFEGSAAAAYDITFAGADRTMQVQVVPVTGAVRVTEN